MNDEIKEILEEMKIGIETERDKDNIRVDGLCFNWKELKLLLDYITNLQNTKEYLGEVLHEQDLELKDYKSRIEKAVEYINKHKEPLHHSFDEPDCDYWIATNPQDIIDILNGKE